MIADRLRNLRQMAGQGFTQSEASQLCGLYHSHWGVLEQGKQGMQADTLSKIAEAFGISADWLLFGKEPAPTIESIQAAVERTRNSRGES